MDDPLRQKSVPLAAETVLWFEFLIDPSLLTTHLQKEGNAGPSPVELITQFLSKPVPNLPISVQSVDLPMTPSDKSCPDDPFEAFQSMGRKQLAMKVLSLKVASFLKWELDIFERNLPVQKQVQLLQDLCIVTAGKMMEMPITADTDLSIGPDGNKSAFKFALTLYHRWVLRTQMLKELPSRMAKQGPSLMMGVQDPNNPFRTDPFIALLDSHLSHSIAYLHRIVSDPVAETEAEKFVALSYDSFAAITSATPIGQRQTFEQLTPISLTELRCQIYFDLCTFYLHVKQYDMARDNALLCRKGLDDLKLEYSQKRDGTPQFLFCMTNETELEGCLMACGVDDRARTELLHRMNESRVNGFVGLIDILQQDNVHMEIPLVNRRIVELDIEDVAAPAHLLVQVAALNCIRAVLEPNSLFAFNDFLHKYRAIDGMAVLVGFAGDLLPKLDVARTVRLKRFFLDLLVTSANATNDLKLVGKLPGFSESELLDIQRQHTRDEIVLPAIAHMQDWKISDYKMPRLEVGMLQRLLINSSNPQKIKVLLVRLAGTNSNQPLWTMNPSWVLPSNLHSIIMSLQRCFLQDFAYILLGKSKELMAKNEFAAAISMLAYLKSECTRPEMMINPAVRKLDKVLDWEILFVQLSHTLDAWPKPCYDQQLLVQNAKQCIHALHAGDSVLPRIEIVDLCAAMLLNLGDWPAVISLPGKRIQSIELCSAFAAAVVEAETFGGVKKICRDAWDLVIPMFLMANNGNNGGKQQGGGRGGGGGGQQQQQQQQGSARDSPSLMVGTNLTPFLKKMRNVAVISVVLSLLAKLHNVLKDDTNMELQSEHLSLWPASVSNATAYSIRAVSETLSSLLKQGLKYYPQHVPWIRLNGEFEFVNENNETAMACYVNTLLTGTEYCTIHLQRPLLDDYIVRRMIKASLNLGCNIQAAILCQFLEEIDYVLAFKCIAERTTFKNIGDRSTHFCDAMDTFYGCVWDATLLEYIIQLHSRKGEHKRRQQAIAIMGQMELNANNSDEIKREAASIRRTRFLRALAKQYLI